MPLQNRYRDDGILNKITETRKEVRLRNAFTGQRTLGHTYDRRYSFCGGFIRRTIERDERDESPYPQFNWMMHTRTLRQRKIYKLYIINGGDSSRCFITPRSSSLNDPYHKEISQDTTSTSIEVSSLHSILLRGRRSFRLGESNVAISPYLVTSIPTLVLS